jgi:hypothetical protein
MTPHLIKNVAVNEDGLLPVITFHYDRSTLRVASDSPSRKNAWSFQEFGPSEPVISHTSWANALMGSLSAT